jgi:hypothetical protein
MRPRLFNLMAATSLVLCLVTVVLWTRSFASETILLESHRGQCLIIGIDAVPPKVVRESRDAVTLDLFLTDLRSPPPTINGVATPRPREHHLLGFTWARGAMGKVVVRSTDNNFWTPPFWILGVPHWFLALLTIALPLRWLWRRLTTAQRRRSNLCPICGYDLRATPDRCPECGKSTAAGAAG